MNGQIRVIVIEQEALFRRGLVAVLESTPDLDAAGNAENAEDGYRLAEAVDPDVALVGTTVTDAPGITLASQMRRRYPAIAIVVIAASESDDELFGAIRAGASAYCGRDVGEEMLLALIRRSATGEYVINEQLLSKPYVAARVLEQFRNSTIVDVALSDAFMPLTDRELEILRKVSDGMTNAAIGEALGISPQTVKNHVTSILRKLAVNDRTQAVVTALRHGWLRLSDAPLDGSTPAGVTDTPTSRLGAAADDDL
ncbi:MAG: Two-component transcriptional response regulator, LuxR family [uncultured Thermomicrobiales bacterium]|uniref:Two-component transcriptional response regulator, LuxR family n=1 Tax=uncultured Thermomicrobiales bacterium TaxID=1645740 RepID=A0A6J4V665_9BACT|nr:MAG: Two-component transcriptional response regulator, LuxR family [uncultured Thermomicrobiales bacterium]